MTTQTTILTKDEAEAIYTTMRALEKVGAEKFSCLIGCLAIEKNWRGEVVMLNIEGFSRLEEHASQAAFATAYGLNSNT